MDRKLDVNFNYIIAVIFMLFFVVNDLVFDFLLTFKSSDIISLCCTLAAAIITFVATYKVTKSQIIEQTDKLSAFIKSNFNGWQIIFSVLDIVCGFISILSGIAYLAVIFKFVKFATIPIKFTVIVNKGKTVIKSVTKVSILWTAGRMLTKSTNKGENKMFKWIKNNKLTLTYCLVLGALSGYCGFTLPVKYFGTPLWANILICVAAVAVTIFLVVLLGGDKIKQAIFRQLSKTLNADNYNKVVEAANKLIEAQEIEEIAKNEIKAEKKAQQKEAKVKAKKAKTEEELKAEQQKAAADAEFRARVEAEKAKLKATETNIQK